MDDILGLPADLMTALSVIITGVIIPLVTALLKRPELPVTARRIIPIALAALGAFIIILFQAGGPFAEQAITWLLMLATLVGIAQSLYAAMPSVWKQIEAKTSPAPVASDDRIDRKGGTNV